MRFLVFLLSLSSASIYAIDRNTGDRIPIDGCTSNELLEDAICLVSRLEWDFSQATFDAMQAMPLGVYERLNEHSLLGLLRDGFPIAEWLNNCNERRLQLISSRTAFFTNQYRPSQEDFDELNHLVRIHLDLYHLLANLDINRRDLLEILGLNTTRARQTQNRPLVEALEALLTVRQNVFAERAHSTALELKNMEISDLVLLRQIGRFIQQAELNAMRSPSPVSTSSEVSSETSSAAPFSPGQTDEQLCETEAPVNILPDTEDAMPLGLAYDVPLLQTQAAIPAVDASLQAQALDFSSQIPAQPQVPLYFPEEISDEAYYFYVDDESILGPCYGQVQNVDGFNPDDFLQ